MTETEEKLPADLLKEIYANGIDGTTGDYSLPPMSSAALAGVIKGESGPENLNELQFKKNRPVDSPVSEAVQDPTDLAQAGWAVVFPAAMDEKRREAHQGGAQTVAGSSPGEGREPVPCLRG